MREPEVTKEYGEEVIEEAGEDYRWWHYQFDFGDREYRVRIYTDQLNVAFVLLIRGDRRTRLAQWLDASRDRRLHVIHRHLVPTRADLSRFTLPIAGADTGGSHWTDHGAAALFSTGVHSCTHLR